ncbi:MAG: hypothetical protein H6913_03455 [Altererythrobacter sp.]|nr:hypothetical protein [Altererythrobacter sp.]
MPEVIEPSELDGETILVGLTRVAADGSTVQEQFGGKARIVDGKKLCLVYVDCTDGETRNWPFDNRSLERARPGEYQLNSTGEIFENPKFLMTWTVTKDETE